MGVSRDYLNKTHGQFRSNAFVKWRLKDSEAWHHAPALLLCVDAQGVALGLSPGRLGQGWAMSIGDQLSSLTPPGMETIANWADPMGQEDEPPSGDYLVGVRLGLGEALGHTDLVGEVIRVAAALQPAMDCVVALAKAERKAVGGGGSEAGVHPDEAEFEELDPVDEGEELEKAFLLRSILGQRIHC